MTRKERNALLGAGLAPGWGTERVPGPGSARPDLRPVSVPSEVPSPHQLVRAPDRRVGLLPVAADPKTHSGSPIRTAVGVRIEAQDLPDAGAAEGDRDRAFSAARELPDRATGREAVAVLREISRKLDRLIVLLPDRGTARVVAAGPAISPASVERASEPLSREREREAERRGPRDRTLTLSRVFRSFLGLPAASRSSVGTRREGLAPPVSGTGPYSFLGPLLQPVLFPQRTTPGQMGGSVFDPFRPRAGQSNPMPLFLGMASSLVHFFGGLGAPGGVRPGGTFGGPETHPAPAGAPRAERPGSVRTDSSVLDLVLAALHAAGGRMREDDRDAPDRQTEFEERTGSPVLETLRSVDFHAEQAVNRLDRILEWLKRAHEREIQDRFDDRDRERKQGDRDILSDILGDEEGEGIVSTVLNLVLANEGRKVLGRTLSRSRNPLLRGAGRFLSSGRFGRGAGRAGGAAGAGRVIRHTAGRGLRHTVGAGSAARTARGLSGGAKILRFARPAAAAAVAVGAMGSLASAGRTARGAGSVVQFPSGKPVALPQTPPKIPKVPVPAGGGAAARVGRSALSRAGGAAAALHAGSGTAGKAAAKAGARTAGKTLGKFAAKKVPFGVGTAISLGLAADRFRKKDFFGGAVELGAGALSAIPYLGTAAAVAMDLGLMARDAKREREGAPDTSQLNWKQALFLGGDELAQTLLAANPAGLLWTPIWKKHVASRGYEALGMDPEAWDPGILPSSWGEMKENLFWRKGPSEEGDADVAAVLSSLDTGVPGAEPEARAANLGGEGLAPRMDGPKPAAPTEPGPVRFARRGNAGPAAPLRDDPRRAAVGLKPNGASFARDPGEAVVRPATAPPAEMALPVLETLRSFDTFRIRHPEPEAAVRHAPSPRMARIFQTDPGRGGGGLGSAAPAGGASSLFPPAALPAAAPAPAPAPPAAPVFEDNKFSIGEDLLILQTLMT